METQTQKISYIIGRQIGADFKGQNMDIDQALFAKGVESAYLGQDSELSDEEMNTVMTAFQTQMQAQAQEMASKLGAENTEKGLAFLEENKSREGVVTTASGLQYKVVTEGTGATPAVDSQVETHYEGRLIDGTVFDSSYQRGQAATFPVNAVIAGWTEALQLMKEGSVLELAIPAALAYGAQGAGQLIGPNATLLFKVELVKVL